MGSRNAIDLDEARRPQAATNAAMLDAWYRWRVRHEDNP
jgi:hypothetical protein